MKLSRFPEFFLNNIRILLNTIRKFLFSFLYTRKNVSNLSLTFKMEIGRKNGSLSVLPRRNVRRFREGFMVVILVMAIGTASFYTATEFGKLSLGEMKIAQANADGFRALLLAKAGFQGALGALKKIPEEYLYKSGIALNPPPLPLGGGTIYYKISSEDGKINLNSLLNQDDNQQNLRSVEMLSRLFDQFGIKRENSFRFSIGWIPIFRKSEVARKTRIIPR